MSYLYIGIITVVSYLIARRTGFLSWVKPSMEGKDGKASSRALTNFWYVGLNTVLSLGILYLSYTVVIAQIVNNQAVHAIWALIWLVVIYNVTVLLIFGIITAQNVTEGIRAVRGTNKEEPIIVKTETISEIKPATDETKKPVITNTTSSTDIG